MTPAATRKSNERASLPGNEFDGVLAFSKVVIKSIRSVPVKKNSIARNGLVVQYNADPQPVDGRVYLVSVFVTSRRSVENHCDLTMAGLQRNPAQRLAFR